MSGQDNPALLHIALVTGSLGEGAGGLASAVRAMAIGLADAEVKVGLFSLDLAQAFGPASLPDHPLVENFVVPCGFEPRTRFTWAPQLKQRLKNYCKRNPVSLLHANGVWLGSTRAAVDVAHSLGLPYVISPHGHLQPWAMQHRAWKKKLAWHGYGKRILQGAGLIQAASEFELNGVRALGITAPVARIPNMVEVPTRWPTPIKHGDDRRTCLFLSRVHPSKGLLDLISAWKEVKPSGWRLLVAGPDEAGHLAQVEAMVNQACLQTDIQFVGAVAYSQRWAWYRHADLFVLPTYSENFGISVAEALGAGTPAITTRAAPWSLLNEYQCGWWIDTGAKALTQTLSLATGLGDGQLSAMGARGQTLVRERFSPAAVTQTMLSAYAWTTSRGGKPTCVHD